MQFSAGTTDVATAGTQVQISNTAHRVKAIEVRGRPGNTGNIFFGVSTVSAAGGWTLQPGESKALSFGDGSVKFADFWVDAATDGDDVDWTVVLLDGIPGGV
tara:strand:- start:150 stop:455 length:306 start_codon:yes stop_codon:yes gene_type:complete